MKHKAEVEEKVFDNPELNRIVQRILASGAVTQDDVRSVCSGEPVLTLEELKQIRRVKDLHSEAS